MPKEGQLVSSVLHNLVRQAMPVVAYGKSRPIRITSSCLPLYLVNTDLKVISNCIAWGIYCYSDCAPGYFGGFDSFGVCLWNDCLIPLAVFCGATFFMWNDCLIPLAVFCGATFFMWFLYSKGKSNLEQTLECGSTP